MATSTIRGLILVGLVILGIIAFTKIFPANTSFGVTPAATAGTTSPTVSPSASSSPTPGHSAKARPKGKVTVQVMNGTSRAFFASLVTATLRDDGYKTVTPGTYPTKVSTTTIYYQPGFLPEARRLQRQRFTTAALKPAPPTLGSNIDLQVILGLDVAASPAG